MESSKDNNTEVKNVLLVAGFGTASSDGRRADICPVEQAITDAAGESWSVRRCFTSQIIINIIAKREGIITDSVAEAVERATSEGAKRLVIQPTHLMKGLEYDKLCAVLTDHSGSFEETAIGDPLLSSDEDLRSTADALVEASTDYEDGHTALVFMGHGTEAESNGIYTELQAVLNGMGKKDHYIGTVEAEPSLEDVIAAVNAGNYTRVVLRPLMLAAGNHAVKDMASADDPDSWYSRFCAAGYETECIIEGLGRLPAIQAIYADHAAKATR